MIGDLDQLRERLGAAMREKQAWQRQEQNRLTNWFRGVIGITPPEWELELEAAKEWGIPPWRVRAECSQYWWERWLIQRGARGDAARKT